jgi:hypothetical protein
MQENFDQVYLSGHLMNGLVTPIHLLIQNLTECGKVIFTVQNGAYEYKVTLDNWTAQEEFEGLEECTKVDASGQFFNRLLLVSGDTELPEFCYNSCYACGQEADITFRLGMFVFPPSPDGIWLAGWRQL